MSDGASWTLSLAVRLLPTGRREWGDAMRAELGTVPPGAARWRFVAGCARVAVTQPVGLGSLAYPVAVVAFLAVVAVGTSGIAYAALHIGLLLAAAMFVAVSYAGRRAPLLGPVAAGPVARTVRGAGYVLVGAAGAFVFLHLRQQVDPRPEGAFTGVPIFTAVLALYLVAFLAVTGNRAHARSSTLAAGGLAGLGAAMIWTVAVIDVPPIPADANGALVLVLVAFGVAALARSDDGRQAALAGLLASITTALLIWVSLHLMTTFGPDSWIPALVPMALTPASRVSESRIELADPYVAVLFLGDLLALLLSMTVAVVRDRRPALSAVQVPARPRTA